MGVFIKLVHIVKVFRGEDIAELVTEDVSLGLTSTMGEPVLLERRYTCCITPLAFDQMPQVFCLVFSNDVFHKRLVDLPCFFLYDLVSFPVLGLVRCFGQSPCPILLTRLSLQVVVVFVLVACLIFRVVFLHHSQRTKSLLVVGGAWLSCSLLIHGSPSW